MLSKIDSFLLDKIFEPTGRFFQRWIGIDCLTIGLVFIALTATYQAIMAVQGPTFNRPIAVASWAFWMIGFWAVADDAASIRRGAASGFRNKLREIHRGFRSFWSILTTVMMVVMLRPPVTLGGLTYLFLGLVAPFLALYFSSSTPDPATPSRLRLGLRWIARKVRSIGSPSPLPSPA